MALTPAWTTLKYHAVQRALWTTQARFAIVPAGRGSGKTELAKRRLVRFLPVKKKWPDPRYFFGAPTRDQAKRVAWDHFLRLIPPKWIKGEPSISELKITTIFGSELWIVGLDKPQRIEGIQWDGGVVDECSDQRPGVFDLNIMPALSWRDAWCWRIGVPKRQGVGAVEYRQAYEDACKGELPNTEAFTWPAGDIIPRSALLEAQRILDPKDFSEQYDAKFETAGGGIFHSYDEEYNVRPCAYVPNRPLVVGCDFNVDPMCWVIGHMYPDRVEWIDEIFKRDTNTVQCLNILYERYRDHTGGFEFYGDATGKARKTSASQSDYKHIYNDERFKKLGRTVHYPNANPRIADRFASCNAMFCNAAGERRMFVDNRCKNLKRDCSARFYKPGTTEPDDTGDLGHMTDAMGYPVHYRFPIKMKLAVGTPVITIRSGAA